MFAPVELRSDSQPVQQMALSHIAAACDEQTHRFFQNLPHDDSFCYELIRRAVVKRDASAWELALTQYRAQFEAWVRRFYSSSELSHASEADLEDLVAEAIARCWRNYTPDIYLRSTCLAEVLRYWQDCTRSAVFDWQRRQKRHRRTEAMDDEVMASFPVLPHEESHVESQIDAHELSQRVWAIVGSHCQDQADHFVARRVFVEGQKPRHVYGEAAALFVDQADVYQRLRRLKDKLRRDVNFQRLK